MMDDESSSTLAKIKDAAIGWGVPMFFSAVPFLAWYNVFMDFLRSLGWRFVTAAVSVLMFVCGRIFYLWITEKTRRKEVESKINNDYRRYLEPVPGNGVYRDTRNGEIICPRCVAEKNTPSPMYKIELAFEGMNYVCGACQNKVHCR